MEKFVWEFTNQKKLGRKEFLDYFEKKVFKTIRKYNLLPENRIFRIKKSEDLNTIVLKYVLEQKFNVVFSNKPNIISDNLSDVSEKSFVNLLNGIFSGLLPKENGVGIPLYFHSDKELNLYAKLRNLNGTLRKRDEKIQELFSKFIEKNPDLEINIVKAFGQLVN